MQLAVLALSMVMALSIPAPLTTVRSGSDQTVGVAGNNQTSAVDSGSNGEAAKALEFERVRSEGNQALYNLDYEAARQHYTRMTQLVPNHPAGFIYLANNLWLEMLNKSRRLSSSLYSSGSFYNQDAEQDQFDKKRDREFNDLLGKALAITRARINRNPQDVEMLYYQAAARGLRAGYTVTVKRSFRRAIGDANGSIKEQKRVLKLDPGYMDAYLSIGLYEYVIDSLPFFWRTLARFAGLKGSKTRGIEHLEMVAERGKYTSDDARVLLIGIYTREGKPERALEIISYLAEKYPRNYLFGVERAAMLYRLGRAEEGSSSFRALTDDPTVSKSAVDLVNYQWAEALRSVSDFTGAVERYTAVIKWRGSDSDLVTLAHLHRGQVLDIAGRRSEALAEYEIVLKRENVFDSRKQATELIKKPYVSEK